MQSLTTSNTPLTMSSREIAELTGKEHRNVLADIRKMLEDLRLTYAEFSADLPDKYGRLQPAFVLPKRETLILVSGYSTELRARIIDRWQELESSVAQPPGRLESSEAVEAVQIAEALANMLNLTGSARLGMARGVIGLVAPRLLPVVPAYAIDAPSDSSEGSSEPTASLTTLLRERGVSISATRANRVLESLGFLEERSRTSRNSVFKRYWSVTQPGLRYGKNVTSEKNQNETQPHWFISKAEELINIIQSNS